MDKGFPRWVEDELWNWSRWCWMGEWPHPNPNVKCASAERNYLPPPADEEEGDEIKPIPVNCDRARKVQELYDALPLVEQRILQAEYPRRHEHGDLTASERISSVCRTLKIQATYYKISLGYAKEQVRREFQ